MKTRLLIILFFIFSVSGYSSFAQNNKTINYIQVINNIDSIINITFRAIKSESESSKKNEASSASKVIIELNNQNCKELNSKLIPELELVLHDQFGSDENISNQIHPFIVSLKECTEAMSNLTSTQFYKTDKFNDFTNAFLFKELAKGNLFRTLSNINTDRKRFSVSVSFGALFNNVESKMMEQPINEITREKIKSDTYNGDQGFQKTYFNIGFNFSASDKVALDLGFHNFPETGFKGAVNTNNSKKDSASGDSSIYISNNKVAELIHGSCVNLSIMYQLMKLKPSGYGFELKCGGGFGYNNYTVNQNFELIETQKKYNGNFVLVDSTYNEQYNNLEYFIHSVGINLKAVGNYHFNKNISIQLGISQYFDFGANISEQTFHNTTINASKIHFNTFAIDVGLAAHF